jgi:hypothetical protein
MTDNTKIYANDDRWYTIADEATIRADERAKILNEVLEWIPKDLKNNYGMISPDIGYIKAFAELRAKLEEMKGVK